MLNFKQKTVRRLLLLNWKLNEKQKRKMKNEAKITYERGYSRNENYGFLGPWRISSKKPGLEYIRDPNIQRYTLSKKSLGDNFRFSASEHVWGCCKILYFLSYCKNMLNSSRWGWGSWFVFHEIFFGSIVNVYVFAKNVWLPHPW